jgi:hypothetical protein
MNFKARMETEIGRGLHWGLMMRAFKSEGTLLYCALDLK